MATYKGLTLADIIECFTDPSHHMDSQLLNIFLYTYRNYCSSLDIIKLLNTRLKILNEKVKCKDSIPEQNEAFAKAVISLLNSWLRLPFAFDFCESPDFKSINYLLIKIRSWPKVISFIQESESFQESFKRLEERINQVLNIFNTIDETTEINYRELPVDCEFRDSFSVNNQFRDDQYNCSLLYQSADIIANSLTYLDQKVLQNLKLQELLTYIRKNPAPSVTAVFNNYNQLYNIVILTVKEPSLARKRFDQYQYSGRNSPISSQIINRTEIPFNHKICDQRFQVIDKWVQIVQILSNVRNYSSLMAISTALDTPENIKIMKRSSKLYNQYQCLIKMNEPHINQNEEQMISSSEAGSNNSANTNKSKGKYKNLKVQLSEIPYLGTYLKTLTYIDDGFPDFLNASSTVYTGSDERLINIDKCRRQFDVLVQIRLCISAIKNNEVKRDELFLKWYSEIQRECQKNRNSYNGSVQSLESVKSDRSNDSNCSTHSIHEHIALAINNKFVQSNHLHHRLTDEINRQRYLINPRKGSIPSITKIPIQEPELSKVAKVRLKEPKNFEKSFYNLYRSANYLKVKRSDLPKQHDTFSNAALSPRDRPGLSNIIRSSSSINKTDIDIVNLDNILYKKIQINEKDHTTDFIERVFDKYGLVDLDPANFEVVQTLENGREIVITDNANLYYALAEQSQYLIEVHPKNKLHVN